MTAAYVVKTVKDGQPVPGVFDELKAGRARIGWSYQDNLDLRLIREKVQQGDGLDGDQQGAKRCLGFLTRVELEDYLLYPHQPNRGQFSVVQITGEYDYSTKEDGIITAAGNDFRSYRPCLLVTPEPVDIRDEIVPSQLRHRLGCPGRFSKIYDTSSFFTFLKDLPEAGRRQDGSNQASMRRIHNELRKKLLDVLHTEFSRADLSRRFCAKLLRRIHNELRKKLPDVLHTEFSRADLSRQFCAELFERMGYTPDIQEGPAEAGSDIVVTVGDPLLPDEVEFRIGVQVFSYEGIVEDSDLQSKLDQLLRGWEANSLDYGALLTTGRCSTEAKAALLKHNQNEQKKLVRLIDGDDLADLFLKHFPPGME